jgi:hypothetical protein
MKRKTNGKTVPAHGISKTFTVEPLLVSGFFFLVSLWHNSSVSLLRLVSMGPSLDLRVATPITFQSHVGRRVLEPLALYFYPLPELSPYNL